MIYRLILLGVVLGGVLAAPPSVLAQAVPTDAQGYSPYDVKETIVNQGIPGPIREAPALALPNIYGLNPCSLGATVGVTTPLFGLGGAISSTDHDCQIRNTAALAASALDDKVLAREILCNIKEFREAELRLGKPCLADKPSAPVASAAPPNPVAATVPQPGTATPVPQPVASTLTAPASKAPAELVAAAATPAPSLPANQPIIPQSAPAFCHTPNLQLSLYPECQQRTQ